MNLKITIIIPILLTVLIYGGKSKLEKHTIASIPEASGISYCQNTDTLIVANDEGSFYEISPNGKILSRHKLGDYDLEGVVCEEKQILFAVEKGALITIPRLEPKINYQKLKGKQFKLNKKAGIEGIAKVGELYYLTIQSKENKEDAKILVVKCGNNYAKVVETIHHGIIDSAGMEYKDNKLYIVSDKKDKLYIYDLKQKKIIKKVKLPKFAQEGITFGKNGDVFFADDDGAVMRYTLKELGL
ncbi:MAG TPA: hypothetical protein EYG90_03480 [Campylobacterales bacterium]|nr:hypothetical protein [Campylobacterales bacterium]